MSIKLQVLLFIFLVVVTVSITSMADVSNRIIDERTKILCKEYAERDHEKEIAPERYKWLGKEFVDSFDWYGSCLDHIKYPVVGVKN